MNGVIERSEQSVDRLIQNLEKVSLCIIILHHQPELIIQPIQGVRVQILYPTVYHQLHQVCDQLRVLSQVDIHLHTFGFEPFVHFTLSPSHSLNHLLSDLYRGRIGFGVSA